MRTSRHSGMNLCKALGIVFCLGLMSQPTALAAAGEHHLSAAHDLQQAFADVQNGESFHARTAAAERLRILIGEIDPTVIDDRMLSEIIGLLDTHEDYVRAEVAVALGSLGPRARPAVPKLLSVLPEANCLLVSLSPDGAIRVALARIGAKVPVLPRCPWEIAADHDPKSPFVMTPTILRSSVDTFDGAMMTVVGWMTLEPEDANLWTSQDDMVSLRSAHCVSLENVDPFWKQRRAFAGHRVKVTGTFRKDVVGDTGTIRFAACTNSAIELVSVRVLSIP